mmetsp:Transcript_45893/g.56308  ORF Transcript_45893/g.56308 Transcript_45893/m.56308 type:complete len:124 (-) Transcript_45893:40-411(-)
MAMLLLCMMLVATHALREMEGAKELSAGSFGAVETDGKCRAIPGIPGFAAHDINCGAMNKEGMCSMLTATCRWVPARLIAAHCKAKPDQPNQKAVCQANRNNGMVCTRLPQFCDWVPAEKVYD